MWMKEVIERIGLRRLTPSVNPLRRRYVDRVLEKAGLVKLSSLTLGFGPFSLFRHSIFPESIGISLHHLLQRLAERGVPVIRSAVMGDVILSGPRARA